MFTDVSMWLIELAIKTTILLGLAIVADRLLRGTAARVRYRMWTVAILGVLALPTLAMITPEWRIPLLPAPPRDVTSPMPPETASNPDSADSLASTSSFPELSRTRQPGEIPNRLLPVGALPSAVPSLVGAIDRLPELSTADREPVLAQADIASDPAEGTATGTGIDTEPDPAFGSFAWSALLVATWISGMVVMAATLLVAWSRARGIAAAGVPLRDRGWKRLVREACRRTSLRSRVRLLDNARVPTPMTMGHWNPVVLMPEAARSWSDDRRRVVLLHELVHVKRGDWLLQVLAQIACSIFWFHPLMWISARRLAAEREHACDDDVIALGTRPSDYASHLLDVARASLGRRSRLPAATLAMASRSELEGRLISILHPRKRRLNPRAALPTMLTMASLVTVLAAIQPWSRADGPIPYAHEPGPSTFASEAPAEPEATTPPATDNDPAEAKPRVAESEDDSRETHPTDDDATVGATPESDGTVPPLSLAQHQIESGDTVAAEVTLRRIVAATPANASAWALLGYVLAESGNLELAIDANRQAIQRADAWKTREFSADKKMALYNLACCQARLGRTAQALGSLERSFGIGYWDPQSVRTDTDFASLRGLPEFEGILDRAYRLYRLRDPLH